MAYFSNGSEGMCFDDECATCKYNELPCPVCLVQMEFNYEACNNKVATEILDRFVKNNGKCAMKKFMEENPVCPTLAQNVQK